MKRRKLYISISLASLLLVGCLFAAMGLSYARYRTGAKDGIIFQPGDNTQLYLGSVDAKGNFVDGQSEWLEHDGYYYLSFAVKSTQNDLPISVRLVSSLGAWDNGGTVCLYWNDDVYYATAERIAQGSVLYTQFGEGWVFRFLDSAGQELTWDVPESYLKMDLEFKGTFNTDPSLLQLQVIGNNK